METEEQFNQFTVDTSAGKVLVHDALIKKASGYGQYTIEIQTELDNHQQTISVHSTDSRLYDLAHGEDDHSEIVLKESHFLIERTVQDHYNSY